jgi:dihydroneopterin aldolase
MAKAASHVVTTKVFVRGLEVRAEIGVYERERGITQPLVVDIEAEVEATGWRHLEETVNYETLAAHAAAIAAGGHIGLVETFAQRLAEACVAEPRVRQVRVRVEKLRALEPAAAAAGVEIVARRG